MEALRNSAFKFKRADICLEGLRSITFRLNLVDISHGGAKE
jgi:hypothetical protein